MASSSPPPPPPTTSPPPSSPPPPPPPPAPRKFPAPCWTQDETLALISAYREKWYSLRRRNLRTADWEAVASDVIHRSPNPLSPPKTSAQCRHKMEKLRKRYRTEKQRSLSLPHPHGARFYSPSSWIFFDLMDSMETGSDPQIPQIQPIQQIAHIPSAIALRPIIHAEEKPDLRVKSGINGSKDELGKYFDEILSGMGSAANPIKIRVKNHQNQLNSSRRFEGEDNDYYPNRNHVTPPPPPPPGFKRMFPSQEFDDYSSSSKRIANGEPKRRERDSVGEMVSSIKMLGEGLVRMEKMKMEMMKEIERMRMEMEMKRSQMILESQQLIVNAFIEGFKNNNNNNNKKVKLMEVE